MIPPKAVSICGHQLRHAIDATYYIDDELLLGMTPVACVLKKVPTLVGWRLTAVEPNLQSLLDTTKRGYR